MSDCPKTPNKKHVMSFSGRCRYCGYVFPWPPSYEQLERVLKRRTKLLEAAYKGLQCNRGWGHTISATRWLEKCVKEFMEAVKEPKR